MYKVIETTTNRVVRTFRYPTDAEIHMQSLEDIEAYAHTGAKYDLRFAI